MTKLIIPALIIISLIGFWGGCSDKPDVEVSLSPPITTDSNVTVARSNATLLKFRPKTNMDNPPSVRMINQGDQIIILETQGAWYKVQHVFSGNIGWINSSFVQIESRSQWWSGDTDKARRVAEKIYKDKIFLTNGWPINHVNIEERWNKLVFSVKDGIEFSKKDATECARFAIEQLKQNFPTWRDHQVFLDSEQNGMKYTLVMNDSFESTFLGN